MVNIKFSTKAINLALLTAVILIIWLCYTIYSQWRADWQLTHPAMPTQAILHHDTDEQQLLTAIPNAHMFGKDYSKTPNEMPITNLQLHVTGIVQQYMSDHSLSAKAYISSEGNPEKIYQLGDELAPGTKIYQINADTVVVENNGHLEKLLLHRSKLEFKSREETE